MVERVKENAWRLLIPQGEIGNYRWAQMDDYMEYKRRDLLWQPPVKLALKARASAQDLPGTWGFGFWNDPFNMSLGLQGMARRLPALPDAVWFFHASPPNYLAFSDHHPAQGMLAAVFASRHVPTLLLSLGIPLFFLLPIPLAARRVRKLVHNFVSEDAKLLDMDETVWHNYSIDWGMNQITFSVDGQICYETSIVPTNRLGLLIWIDNQFASFSSRGEINSGTLANTQTAWLDVSDLMVMGAPA